MSTALKVSKINNEKVTAIPLVGEGKDDKKPIKGYNVLPAIFCNLFILAKKQMGKTTLIYKVLKDCIDPRTKVYAFVSTLNKDKNWKAIKRYCKKHNIEFNGYTSIIENDVNILANLVHRLQEEAEDSDDEDEKPEKKVNHIICNDDDCDEDDKPKKRYKYRVPEYMFILDDLSDELMNPAVVALVKKHRHFFSKVIIGNQYWNDFQKSARKQMDFMIIFGEEPLDKLDEIYKQLRLNISFEKFFELYEFATKEKYSFLYIDINNCEYRKNFDLKIHVSK